MKMLFVLGLMCLCPPPATFPEWQWQELPRRTCRECVIVRGYDPVKNRSRLWLKLLPIADVPDGKMYLSLTRDMGEGPAGSPTKVCYVGISVIAKTTLETKHVEVLILADGDPINLGLAALGNTLTNGEKKTSSYLSVTDWDSVSKLGPADKLELHFGGMEIKFDDEHRAAIRDFLAYARGDN